MNDNNTLCKAHSGLNARLDTAEDNVSRLWKKWDSMQKLLIGSLLAGMFNLAGIIVILLTK